MSNIYQKPLQGKVALVTGSSRGIGAAIAIRLANAGADVAITARQLEALVATYQQIEATGQRALAVALEVTNLANIQEAVQTIEAGLGPIDILVNNAGINIPQPATEVTEAQWDQIFDVNLKGVFFCTQAVGRRMIVRNRGKIINISSAAGLIAAHERAAYCPSKAGLNMLTKVLALEWAPHQITVNAVAPTFVETELAAQTLARPGMRDYWNSRIPLGRIASLDDVSEAVIYLASPVADFVTGTVLPVDGGLTMG